jgi:two-component system sensor histidine kinase/response regulator
LSHFAKPRILVAEDNGLNQRVIRELLQHRGYEVDVVDGGFEAIETLKKGEYSLLILDCLMPKLDGFATARMIRSNGSSGCNRDIPILATTALATERDRQRCLEAGMDDYLSKPIKAALLFERVEKLIAGSSETGGNAAAPAFRVREHDQDNQRLEQSVVEAMAGRLVEDAREWESELVLLSQSGDWVAVRNLAHKIRGAADVFALADLSKLAATLENNATYNAEPARTNSLMEVIDGLRRVSTELGQRS